MKPEQALWKHARPYFNKLGSAQRVENKTGTGMPDVYLRNTAERRCCWIELKVAELVSDKLRCPHHTEIQRIWGGNQWEVSQNSFVLCKLVMSQGAQLALFRGDYMRNNSLHGMSYSTFSSECIGIDYSVRSLLEQPEVIKAIKQGK